MNFLIKYHKWVSVVTALFIILFSLSGIVLNHRESLSSVSVSRDLLPEEYSLKNWNNAAVKATLKINENSFLIYGNIGIWQTDSTFKDYADFNNGLPEGVDNRKVCSMLKSSKGDIFAGTFFGLYKYNSQLHSWNLVNIPTHEKRIVDLIEKDSEILILTRSHLIFSDINTSTFEVKELPSPENYDNKIGLFKTLWVIHSGEIMGTVGKYFVDFLALIFLFLTLTGLIVFVNKLRLPRKAKANMAAVLEGNTSNKAQKSLMRIAKTNRWNLKWHNKVGWITVIFLIITTATGMFLRPPLLIGIADAKVGKIPGTELASPNAWFDKLRRIIYDDQKERYIISTLDGVYYSDDEFNTPLKKFDVQPPISVMGATVFHKKSENTYMLGSFEGLFTWNSETGIIMDYVKKIPYVKPEVKGPPIGDYLVTGYTDDFRNQSIIFTYNGGALNINNGIEFPHHTPDIKEAYGMSLWNLALEIHTARMYKFMFGIFYILVIPLAGFSILFILISGLIVWWKLHR